MRARVRAHTRACADLGSLILVPMESALTCEVNLSGKIAQAVKVSAGGTGKQDGVQQTFGQARRPWLMWNWRDLALVG